MPDPPADWIAAGALVSEIWTPSSFSRDALAKMFSHPIHVTPHFIPAELPRQRDAAQPFTVLTMADSRSSFARKNPLAAIAAFRQAFGTDSRARLLVKLNGRPEEMAGLAAAIGNSPNIEIVSGLLDDAGLDRLYRSADVLLSLHRAEGFGLPMAEAMARGIPVVGTGWSGNLEFMDARNSALVPYQLVQVNDSAGIYSGSHWAEPDVAAAATALRRLADDRAHYDAIAAAAYASMAMAEPRLAPGAAPAAAPALAGGMPGSLPESLLPPMMAAAVPALSA